MEPDQLAPRSLRAEEVRESRHDVHWDCFGSQHFAAELQQAAVVADVGVGQKNAIEPRSRCRLANFIEGVQLFAKVRCAFKQPALVRARIDEGEADDMSSSRGVVPSFRAASAAATGLWVASILSHSEDHQPRFHAGRGVLILSSSNGWQPKKRSSSHHQGALPIVPRHSHLLIPFGKIPQVAFAVGLSVGGAVRWPNIAKSASTSIKAASIRGTK